MLDLLDPRKNRPTPFGKSEGQAETSWAWPSTAVIARRPFRLPSLSEPTSERDNYFAGQERREGTTKDEEPRPRS